MNYEQMALAARCSDLWQAQGMEFFTFLLGFAKVVLVAVTIITPITIAITIAIIIDGYSCDNRGYRDKPFFAAVRAALDDLDKLLKGENTIDD